MSATERLDAGIGITYALRYLRFPLKIFYSIRRFHMDYYWIDGVEHTRRMKAIEKIVRNQGVYYTLYEGVQLTGTALFFVREADKIVDYCIDHGGVSGRADYHWIKKSYSGILDQMERELRRLGMAPPEEVIPAEEGKNAKWLWDKYRKSYYYWSGPDQVFKYQSGEWMRRDGSMPSAAEVAEWKKARVEEVVERPPPPSGLSCIDETTEATPSM